MAAPLYGLLIGLEGRMPGDDAWIIHEFIDRRHYGLALEEIARTLTHRAIAITGQERADILALAARVDELAAADGSRPTADLARAVITDLPAS